MKASVIIINYNNAKYVDQCIRSILLQSYKNFEIIFVDDNSQDNSLEVIKKYKKKIRIVKKKNKIGKGSYDQMFGFFEGFKKSKGEIIFFLDSDDFFHKNKLLSVMNKYNKNKNCKILYDLPIKKFNNSSTYVKLKKFYLLGNFWPYFVPTSCISIRRNFFLKLFKKINFKLFPNIWFDFRVGLSGIYLYNQYNFVDKNLTYYRQINNNISSNFKHLSKNWWMRRLEAHNFVKFFFKKHKIKYKKNFDFYLTYFMNYLSR